MVPAVPKALCADKLDPNLGITPVKLPTAVAHPDHRESVRKDTIAAAQKALIAARKALKGATNEAKVKQEELSLAIAEAKYAEVVAVIKTEDFEKNSEAWKAAAQEAVAKQRALAVAEARLKWFQAQTAEAESRKKADDLAAAADQQQTQGTNTVSTAKTEKAQKDKSDKASKELAAAKKKTSDAEKTLAEKEKELASAPSTAFKPRSTDDYPDVSTGRRLAFAKWVANTDNPLTARVAMNHIWLRHFGRGIVPTPADFGRNGLPASNPALLDWLASEFMARQWSMKAMHRLLVTSSTYRMSSTSDPVNLQG